jgi:tetratricopeptide (TPR) repeat protein
LIKGLLLGASRYYYSQGLISFDAQQYKKAQSNFSIATQLDTKYVGAYNNLAASCKNLKESNCAESNYKKAISLDGNSWELNYSLASFYEEQAYEKTRSESERQKLLNLSRSNYKQALQKGGSQAVESLNNLSRLEILHKNYQAGIDIANQGIGLTQDPLTLGALYKNRGWATFELGRVPEARKDLEQASKLNPNQADAHCLLVQLLEADRQPILMKASLGQCLRIIAVNPEIKAVQDRLLDRLIGR